MNIIGTVINGYQITEFIDSGGFGSVYKAIKSGNEYAIKIFREDYVLMEFREKGEKNRIKREIEIMKSVNHPYLIRYVDDFMETLLGVPSFFLVMEYAQGKTLKKLITDNSIIESQAIVISVKILEGLNALHNIRGDDEDKGIIHRDLKPENIIVAHNGEIKIVDYGISKVIDYTSITSTGDVMGSPIYMSPEQITDSKHIDKRSDLYTIGVIMYEMLTKKLPYEYNSLPELYDKIKNGNPIPPRRWLPLINNKIENIILKLLEKNPYQRFTKASLIIDAIKSEEIKFVEKTYDLTPKYLLRLWNEKSVLQTFIEKYNKKISVEFPANFQKQQRKLLNLIQSSQFERIIDPATMRLAYPAQQDIKGLQELPYAPPKFHIISPDYLQDNDKKKDYVKKVIDEQYRLGADILVSPYHYIHNTNVPATQRRNPVAEWFDLDIKLLKESIDYKLSISDYNNKLLFAGICLNVDCLLDEKDKKDLLNMFSAFDCDGYFIYVDCIDNNTNKTTLYHYIKTLVELQKSTLKPVIAGRLNSLGLGLLCAGVSAYTSGAARFESFYEDLYKEENEAYIMHERYYFPQLLGTIAIEKKNPIKLKAIMDILGPCNCNYCNGKNYIDMIDAPNNKLHFLENIHNEVETIKSLSHNERLSYFIDRIDKAIFNYKRLHNIFRANEFQHLINWKDVFTELNKVF
ncbi:MAG: serine/threonine protein kinase [Ignavibacteriae bacterium]|nr:serine/threonine protein kinase [Ignavibacteriota bacterium]